MKAAAQVGRRVSNLGKTAQSKVVAQHEAVASAMNHRRNPTVAKELVEAAAAAVEAQISVEEAKVRALWSLCLFRIRCCC